MSDTIEITDTFGPTSVEGMWLASFDEPESKAYRPHPLTDAERSARTTLGWQKRKRATRIFGFATTEMQLPPGVTFSGIDVPSVKELETKWGTDVDAIETRVQGVIGKQTKVKIDLSKTTGRSVTVQAAAWGEAIEQLTARYPGMWTHVTDVRLTDTTTKPTSPGVAGAVSATPRGLKHTVWADAVTQFAKAGADMRSTPTPTVSHIANAVLTPQYAGDFDKDKFWLRQARVAYSVTLHEAAHVIDFSVRNQRKIEFDPVVNKPGRWHGIARLDLLTPRIGTKDPAVLDAAVPSPYALFDIKGGRYEWFAETFTANWLGMKAPGYDAQGLVVSSTLAYVDKYMAMMRPLPTMAVPRATKSVPCNAMHAFF